MAGFIIILLTLFVSILNGVVPGYSLLTTAQSSTCDCISPVYVDKPTNITQCYSRVKYQNQIYLSYSQMFSRLFLLNIGKNCDFTEFITLLLGMQRRTLGVVDSFFQCTQLNCTPSVFNGYDNYNEYKNLYNNYTFCGMARLSSDCAQILYTIRPLVYASVENTMTSMLACSNLKTGNTGVNIAAKFDVPEIPPRWSKPISTQNALNDCNCVFISDRPIPVTESECFSAEFIAKVNTFITDNHKRISDSYNSNTNPKCDYTQLTGYIGRLKEIAYGFASVLTRSTPTFAEVDEMFAVYVDVRSQFSDALRTYILNNDKSCYFLPRKARQNPMALIDNVVAVLNKCVAYKDKSVRKC